LAQVLVDRGASPERVAEPPAEFRAHRRAPHRHRCHPDEWKKRPHNGKSTRERDITAERVEQRESRDEARVSRGDGRGDGGADVVTDQAAASDSEGAHEADQPGGMTLNRKVGKLRDIRPTKPEQIRDNDPVTRRKKRYEVAPEVAAAREPVHEG
jgi:hypothetical protein